MSSNQQQKKIIKMFRNISREKSWICGELGHFNHRLLYPLMFSQSNWLFKTHSTLIQQTNSITFLRINWHQTQYFLMNYCIFFFTYRHSFSDIVEIQNAQQIIDFLFPIDFNCNCGGCTRLKDKNQIAWQLRSYKGT